MLAIKLRRIGKKHQPSYRLIVTEKTSRPQTAGIEDLGWFNPREDKKEFNGERVKHWLSKGAQPTDTVHNLLIAAGILEGKKRPVHKQPKKKEEGKPAVSEAKLVPEAVVPQASAEEKK